MTRRTTNFNIDKAIGRIIKPSVFDRIVKEVDAKEIPAKYIEYILVQYHDGNVVELKGKDISHPIPVSKDSNPDEVQEMFKKMKDVKIFIDTEQLETDVNQYVEKYLGKYC